MTGRYRTIYNMIISLVLRSGFLTLITFIKLQ